MDSKELSRSWFCVLNNPQEIYEGEPHEIAEKCLEEWIADHPTRTGAVAYCISADGLHHLHMVLEDSLKARFSSLKKTYPKAHLDPTKGTKEQAEDYINKRGKYQEKGEQVLYIARFGEIKGNQGARKDLEEIEDMIEQGLTPNQIMDKGIKYRKHEKLIKDTYYRKRYRETPPFRKITTYWHAGESGTGKTFEHVKMIEEHGDDYLYYVTEYEHGFDKYSGEPVLFLNEFKGQLKYGILLGLLEGYRTQVPCRYTNVYSLWNEVHITSKIPIENVYQNMVQENRGIDTIDQLKRRIDYVIYHYKEGDEYRKQKIPMSEYKDYYTLKKQYELMPDWVRQAQEDEKNGVEQLPF